MYTCCDICILMSIVNKTGFEPYLLQVEHSWMALFCSAMKLRSEEMHKYLGLHQTTYRCADHSLGLLRVWEGHASA